MDLPLLEQLEPLNQGPFFSDPLGILFVNNHRFDLEME